MEDYEQFKPEFFSDQTSAERLGCVQRKETHIYRWGWASLTRNHASRHRVRFPPSAREKVTGALAAGKMWEILAATLDLPAFGPVSALSTVGLHRAQESLAGLGVNIQLFLMELNSFKSIVSASNSPHWEVSGARDKACEDRHTVIWGPPGNVWELWYLKKNGGMVGSWWTLEWEPLGFEFWFCCWESWSSHLTSLNFVFL